MVRLHCKLPVEFGGRAANHVNIIKLNLAWLRQNFAPRYVDANIAYKASNHIDRCADERPHKRLECVLLHGHVLFDNQTIPIVDLDVLLGEVLNIASQGSHD